MPWRWPRALYALYVNALHLGVDEQSSQHSSAVSFSSLLMSASMQSMPVCVLHILPLLLVAPAMHAANTAIAIVPGTMALRGSLPDDKVTPHEYVINSCQCGFANLKNLRKQTGKRNNILSRIECNSTPQYTILYMKLLLVFSVHKPI